MSTIVVHDDGLVDIEGNDLKLTLWDHSPGRLRSALNSQGRRVVWKPRYHVLTFRGYSNRLFNMAQPEERKPCKRRARPRPGETVEDFVQRAMREDGGFVLPASSLVSRDALKGSGKNDHGDGGT